MGKTKTIFFSLTIIFLSFFLFSPLCFASGQTRVRVYNSSPQLITNGLITVVRVNTEDYDTLSEFDTTNWTFTALNNGYYLVAGQITWQTSVDQKLHDLYLYKNNASVSQVDLNSSGTTSVSQSFTNTVYLVAGDTLTMRVYQNTGGNRMLLGGAHLGYLTITSLDMPIDNIFYALLIFGSLFVIILVPILILKLKK